MAAQDLTTLANVRQAMQLETGRTEPDPIISMFITVASDLIQEHIGLKAAPAETAATKTYDWDGTDTLFKLKPYVCRSVTAVVIDGTDTLTLNSGYRLYPPQHRESIYTHLELYVTSSLSGNFPTRRIAVTGNWGYSTIPTILEHAALTTVIIWMRRDVSAFTSTYNLDEGKVERPQALPSQVVEMLKYYRGGFFI